MAIRFHCPQCQTHYTVNDRDAGKKSECKVCGVLLEVPTPALAKLAEAPPAAKSTPPPVTLPLVEEAEGSRDRYREPDPEPEPPPRPRRRHPDDYGDRDDHREPERPHFSALAILSIAVWMVTLGATALIGLLWLGMMQKAETVFQESAINAMVAAWLIGVYIVARSIDKILGAVRTGRSRT